MYTPLIRNARCHRQYDFGNYKASLLVDIESAGVMKYEYIMVLFRKDERDPLLFVCVDWNTMLKERPKEIVMDVFEGGGRMAVGSSADWYELSAFERRALEIVKQKIAAEEKGGHKIHTEEGDTRGKHFIGEAVMDPDGTIRMRLKAEGIPGLVGYANFDYPPDHPEYQEVLEHLGGMQPGEKKLVPPWPN